MDKPLVSIITPCYNGQSYLHRYFKSILNQTYGKIELIFVNDCSTDKTRTIVENYQPKLKAKKIKTKIIHLPKNMGAAGAVNAGLKYFTGDYVMFPDSDDIMYPNHIEEKVKFMENNKQYAWAACKIRKVKEAKLSKTVGMLQIKHTSAMENIFERLIIQDRVCFSPIGFIFRTSCFLEVNPSRSIFVTKAGQNWQLLLPIAYKFDCAFIDKVLGDYVIRKNSTSRTENRPAALDKTNAREIILTETIKRINPDNEQLYLNTIKRLYGKKLKVMIIGGTGKLGKDVTKRCVALKHDVYVVSRGIKKPDLPKETKLIIANIEKDTDKLSNILKGMLFDVVVDFLAYTPRQLSHHLALFRGKCRQYIFISSATAYEHTEKLITEETPLANRSWGYSKNKIMCELLLKNEYKKTASYYTIIRPYITYGDTRIPYAFISKNCQGTLIHRLLNGGLIPIWSDNLCTLTHTEDFARALVGLFGNKKAINQDFHITSDENITWGQALELIGKAIGVKPRTIHIPAKIIEKVFTSLRGELTCDKACTRIFDNSKIKDAVPGWECKIKFEDGIKRTIQYYLIPSRSRMMRISEAWERKTDILIDGYERGKFNG